MIQDWLEVLREMRLDLAGSLLLAVVLGGAVGLEREIKGKPAGLRTNILICVGAALFTQISIDVGQGSGDPGRIAAQIVTGVGFIGAGTILHSRGSISGLTSAATIWLVAAIGVAIGAGMLVEAMGSTVLVLVVLGALAPLESLLRRRSGVTKVVIEVPAEPGQVQEIERVVREAGLEIEALRSKQVDDRLEIEVTMRGPARAHDNAKLELLRASGHYSISVEE